MGGALHRLHYLIIITDEEGETPSAATARQPREKREDGGVGDKVEGLELRLVVLLR
jgi:hypothetical protein